MNFIKAKKDKLKLNEREERMNKTIEIQLNHRTIRAWKEEPLKEDEVQELFDVAMRASTSNGMQQASIIRVKDPEKRQVLSEITTQKYIVDAPELLVFIADNYRNHQILEEKGAKENYTNDADRLLQGITDASIMAQNVTVAAESKGWGVVYFGSILNDPERLVKVLNLPQYTFPVLALGIGIPDQEPQLKPRMDKAYRVFDDEYKSFDSYTEELKDYDEEMTQYYDLRDANRRVDSFTKQVVDKNQITIAKRPEIIRVLKDQGYDL